MKVFYFPFLFLLTMTVHLGARQVDVDELLKQVRLVAVAQNTELDGQLSSGRNRSKVKMYLKGKSIQYQIDANNRRIIYQLILNEESQRLQLYEKGQWNPLPKAEYNRTIGDTALTYEDLSLRFLYWPKGKVVGEDNIQSVDCLRVLLRNPDGEGSYASVLVWIGKANAALMRIEGFNEKNEALKRFQVGKVMKLDGGFFVKTMEVYPFQEGGRRLGRPTYIEFEKPSAVAKRP